MAATRKFPAATRLRRHLLAAAALAPVMLAVYFAGFWLRFDGQFDPGVLWKFAATAGFVVAVKVVLLVRLRVCNSWGRFVTFHDLVVLCKAASLSSLIIVLGDYVFYSSLQIPRSVVFFDWAATIIFIGGSQMLSRVVAERQLGGISWRDATPVLIAGANGGGEALLRAIRRDPKLSYRVVGFLAENAAATGKFIGGVPVVGLLDDACHLASKYQVADIFITAGELPGSQIRKLMDSGAASDVNVKVVPSYEQLLTGSVDLRPRPVSIDDLLRRKPVELNIDQLSRWIDDRVLLVTGAAGSIGSEICRQLLQFRPKKLVLVDRSENGQFFLERQLRELAPNSEIEICIADINDAQRMNSVFKTYAPNIVFHAAAYKHVPLMEANTGEAVKNITLATRMLADLAHQHQVESFVMISTDKAVNPTSAMGACKRIAELYVQALAAKSSCCFVTVRFGNVLDSEGSVVPIFREQIARGGPVTVTHPDITRYFMTIPEASQLVIQAGAMGSGGEIFVLDMGDPIKIVDLAADMIRLSGLKVDEDIQIKVTGLRPGEKLYEELNAEGEQHLDTCHPKIFVASSVRRNVAQIRESIAQLEQITDGPNALIQAEIQQIVPEYRRPQTDEHRRAQAA